MNVTINELIIEAHNTAKDHGWWQDNRTVGDCIALMHSELSEALEEYRKGHRPEETYVVVEKPEGVPAELADVLIRIADFCGMHNIDLDGALKLKLEYNRSRPYRHGGKAL